MKGAVVSLIVLTVFLSDRLVRVENQRYALEVGMCPLEINGIRMSGPSPSCLEKVQTRISWFAHLYFAVSDRVPAVPLFSP
jgi:hypothetical protein